jgi:hypothetical protein
LSHGLHISFTQNEPHPVPPPYRRNTSPYPPRPRDISTASTLIAPNITVQRDDLPPITSHDAFLLEWQNALERMPDFRMAILETALDCSEPLTARCGGIVKESWRPLI